MKRFFYPTILAFITLISATLSASNPADWETYFENDTVKIEYIYQNCEYLEQFDSEYVFFTIENKLDKKISFSCSEILFYDKSELISDENRMKLTMEPYEVISGNCEEHYRLSIFSKFTEKLEDMPGVNKIHSLTNFILNDIATEIYE